MSDPYKPVETSVKNAAKRIGEDGAHGFAKHAHEFSDPALGHVDNLIRVKTPEDYKRLIGNVLNDPKTLAFKTPDDSFFYNEKYNIFVVNHDRLHSGEGTAYRPKDFKAHFDQSFSGSARHYSSQGITIDTPKSGGYAALHFSDNIAGKKAAYIASLGDEISTFGKALRMLGKVTKVLGPIGAFAAANEAQAFVQKADEAYEHGLLPKEALAEYHLIMAEALTQATADPTMVGGELVVNAHYDDFAERYNLNPALKTQLEPSSLIKDVIAGAVVVGGAANDVAQYALEQAGDCFDATGRTARNALDHVTGDAQRRENLYNVLPVLDFGALKTNGSISIQADGDLAVMPISSDGVSYDNITQDSLAHNPELSAMVAAKTNAENLEKLMAEIGASHAPDKTQKLEYIQGRLDDINEHFTDLYRTAKDLETLDSIENYATGYQDHVAGRAAAISCTPVSLLFDIPQEQNEQNMSMGPSS